MDSASEKDTTLKIFIEPRRFKLVRDKDHSGISGTGHVADGVVFPSGKTVICWRVITSSIVVYDCPDHVEAIHGHNGSTRIEWID